MMQALIGAVNRLQDAASLAGVDVLSLPQIAVVGGQSSGKSSVLENIVGRDFLPRGSGIVTRRPLVLQLIHSPDVAREYGEFLHLPGQKFEDFEAIRAEISAATDRETGTNKGVSDSPINLRICSPDVLNLTLVDLPGITRVPVGDQPADIEQRIRSMVLRYISSPNTIILAVTAANTDLANSDALQLALEVDPAGERTIGVLTKLDLMDRGTDAADVLEGRVIPLRLGYIGVVNRSQADIASRMRIREQWKAEEKFFRSHPAYGHLAARCGTAYLARVLSRTLTAHIRHCLPDIAHRLARSLDQRRAELAGYADVADGAGRQRAVLGALTDYSGRFTALLAGTGDEVSSSRLEGGARLARLIEVEFVQRVDAMEVLQRLPARDIAILIRNCGGFRSNIFIPDHSFEVVLRRAIKELEPPALACVDAVYNELLSLVEGVATASLTRFHVLRQRVLSAARALLAAYVQPTRELVRTLVEMELCRINTQHPDFVGRRMGVGALMAEVAQEMAASRGRLTAYSSSSNMSEEEAGEDTLHARPLVHGRLERVQRILGRSRAVPMVASIRERKLHFGDSDVAVPKVLDLDGATLQVRPDGLEFELTGPRLRKTYTWRAPSKEELERWRKGIPIAASAERWAAFMAANAERSRGVEAASPVPPVPERRNPALPPRPAPPPPSAAASATAAAAGASGVPPAPAGAAVEEEPVSEAEAVETEVIRRLMASYFNIVKKKLVDSVPKAISLKLVLRARTELQNELVAALYRPELVEELLSESEDVVQRRKHCAEAVRLMEAALRTIHEAQVEGMPGEEAA